jgi:hypothetical protein
MLYGHRAFVDFHVDQCRSCRFQLDQQICKFSDEEHFWRINGRNIWVFFTHNSFGLMLQDDARQLNYNP